MDLKNFEARTHCPACNSKDTSTIYERSFSDLSIKSYLVKFYGRQGNLDYSWLENNHYVLEECHVCGLVYQKQILNDLLMEKLYEQWINPKIVFAEEEKTFDLGYYARYTSEIGMLLSYFNTVPTQLKFFDFGMGWGKWLKMANGFGVHSYGAELSQSRIDYAKKFGINVISWDELGVHQFDFINTEQVFEHLPQPLETLLHLKKALKPGGLIKISVPDGSDIKRRLRIADWQAEKKSKNSLNAVSPLEHINCFNFNAIMIMAKKASLQRVKIPLRDQYSFLDNNTTIRNVLVNIAKPFYRNYGKPTYLFFGHST
jgi:2-polyprenyl-3-methyl-5-hydroxy-6-metoxy-1,4-benzoquinol methylase